MPDITLSVLVTRDWLGLADLQINDGTVYKIGAQFLGGNVSWKRNEVESAYMDSSVTINRTRQKVNETAQVEVSGSSASQLQTRMAALIAAFAQDSFTVTIVIDGATYAYACEAADYQVVWSGPRMVAKRGQVSFSVPRHPVPLAGSV